MSTCGQQQSEDQFLCSICLDIFTDPVTTACGHNFCKACISQHWKADDRCRCPVCNEQFYPKPNLQTNTLMSELAEEFRSAKVPLEQNAAPPEEVPGAPPEEVPGAPPEEVPGDSSIRALWRSQKFWVALGCLLIVFASMIAKHHQKEEENGKLMKMEAEIDQKLQQIQQKIEEINVSIEGSKEAAGRQEAEGVQVFTALKEMVEKGQEEFIQTSRKRQKTTEEQAEAFRKELQQLMWELKMMRSEVEMLSAANLEEALAEQIKKEIPKLLIRAELKRCQRYAVDVTLDPDTAHPRMVVSEDGKRVWTGDVHRKLPETPQRFSHCINVLGMQGFSSGRFYFEVQVKGKPDWDVGVALESINRNVQVILTPQNGYWTIWLKNGIDYKAHAGPAVDLPLRSDPEKVGVFVDYEEGLVSFYDVEAEALIYSFTGCSFSGKLFPFFSPGSNNLIPLILTRVKPPE